MQGVQAVDFGLKLDTDLGLLLKRVAEPVQRITHHRSLIIAFLFMQDKLAILPFQLVELSSELFLVVIK